MYFGVIYILLENYNCFIIRLIRRKVFMKKSYINMILYIYSYYWLDISIKI